MRGNNYEYNKEELRERLSTFIHRTLRNQVQKYVKYPKRITKTFVFTPSAEEDELYNCITTLVQSNSTFGLNSSQTMFVSLILRKLLSSSTFAIKKTLKTIKHRLELIIQGENVENLDFSNEFDEDFIEETTGETVVLDLAKITSELVFVNKALDITNKIIDDKKAVEIICQKQY